MLKPGGVDLVLKPYSREKLYASATQGGILASGAFDLTLGTTSGGTDPDDRVLFGCDQFPPKGRNYSRYCSKSMEMWQRKALDNYQHSYRKYPYARIQQLVGSDVPLIAIWFPRQLEPINPDFKGFTPNPVNEAWNAYQWEI